MREICPLARDAPITDDMIVAVVLLLTMVLAADLAELIAARRDSGRRRA